MDFIKREGTVTRDRILERFNCDDELQVQALLRDLTESGMVFCSGIGRRAVYRAATDSELGDLSKIEPESGLEELVWIILHRSGRLKEEKLLQRLEPHLDVAKKALERLYKDGRIKKQKDNTLMAEDFVLTLGLTKGWEAAVFDHFQAVVRTICQRLRLSSVETSESDVIGGSTYSFEICPGHPMVEEVKGQLREIRRRCTDLRQRVDAYNLKNGLVPNYQHIVLYAGQSLVEKERDESERLGEDRCA